MTEERVYRRWYLLPAAALLWNETVYYAGRFLAQGSAHTDMSTSLDGLIPFMPWTVTIYVGCFAFWAAVYVACAKRDRAQARRFYLADALTKGVCLAFFLLLPTTMSRPEALGGDIWSAAVRLLYEIDEPTNLFPSIHCAVSWLCWAGLRGREDTPRGVRAAALAQAVLVAASTLTIKQHVLADAASGILLAELMWQVSGKRTGSEKIQ